MKYKYQQFALHFLIDAAMLPGQPCFVYTTTLAVCCQVLQGVPNSPAHNKFGVLPLSRLQPHQLLRFSAGKEILKNLGWPGKTSLAPPSPAPAPLHFQFDILIKTNKSVLLNRKIEHRCPTCQCTEIIIHETGSLFRGLKRYCTLKRDSHTALFSQLELTACKHCSNHMAKVLNLAG